MTNTKQKVDQIIETVHDADTPYDRRKLSYANTFTNPFQRNTIKTLELLTGKLRLLRKVRQFEKMGIPFGQPFWRQALDLLGIKLLTSKSELSKIPKKLKTVDTKPNANQCLKLKILANNC